MKYIKVPFGGSDGSFRGNGQGRNRVRQGFEIRMRKWKLGKRQGEKITRFSLDDSGREDIRGEGSSKTRRER